MENLITSNISQSEKTEFRQLIQEKYNWEKIARQTIQVYEKTFEK